MYFRVEDENGIFPQLREYGCGSSYNTRVNACDADVLIAQEIREEINNSNQRNVFSYSKSLGVVLFKYNYVADNPIHLIPHGIGCNWVELIINENKVSRYEYINYNIADLNYPIRKKFIDREILLGNYIIEVDNNILLDKYLRNYTDVGKKKIAACEKDREVIIRHAVDDYVIIDHIHAVYLIYALQYTTGFLYKDWVVERLQKIFREKIEEQKEFNAFSYIVFYLKERWEYEKEISQKILGKKLEDARMVPCYDGYHLALDIMKERDYESAWNNSSYYLYDSLIEEIWKIFFAYIS